ncbi:MAG: hypothetical protein ORN28_01090 [Rhodoferax sp.]|nr:hypothetical protein [Rhodoferax sp.]
MISKQTVTFKNALKAIEDEALSEVDVGQVILRGDGYYWQAADGKQEFGPFASMDEALAELQASATEDSAEPGETLQEAEGELGIADWIDPDTGQPAEGQSTPRLHDE